MHQSPGSHARHPAHASTGGIAGAEELRAELDRVTHALTSNVKEMAVLLQPGRKIDSARLNHLLLETNHVVHAGFRMTSATGRLRSADAEAAGDDPEALAAVNRAWAALTMPLNALRLNLVKWPVVESMLRPQVKRRRRPLIESYDSLPETARTRESVADSLFAQVHDLLNPTRQDDGAYAHGCFSDIPLAQSLFLREAHAAQRVLRAMKPGKQTRFLDVGCGAGLKVISAAPYYDRCVGLEYDPGYARLAEKLFREIPHDRCTVVEGDALEWNGYENFDVIYFFRPLRDDAALAKMERRIVDNVPKGTLLIAPYRIFSTRAESYGCAHVAGHIWLTGSTDKDATRVRRAGEMIGPHIQLQGDSNVPLIWDALVKVSRYNGYEPTLLARGPLEDING